MYEHRCQRRADSSGRTGDGTHVAPVEVLVIVIYNERVTTEQKPGQRSDLPV